MMKKTREEKNKSSQLPNAKNGMKMIREKRNMNSLDRKEARRRMRLAGKMERRIQKKNKALCSYDMIPRELTDTVTCCTQ